MDTAAPLFPPLITGAQVDIDPFVAAIDLAREGTPGGTLTFRDKDGTLSAAIVLTPELPLRQAMGVVLALQVAVVDALGASGPPELAVEVHWPDRMTLNGAGGPVWRFAASTTDPDDEPLWLIGAVDLPCAPVSDSPGDTPGRTTLADEGYWPIDTTALLESLSRHMLVWINRFVDEGLAPVAATWCAKCPDIGGPVTAPVAGRMLGLDEMGGLLVSRDGRTEALPLTRALTPPHALR